MVGALTWVASCSIPNTILFSGRSFDDRVPERMPERFAERCMDRSAGARPAPAEAAFPRPLPGDPPAPSPPVSPLLAKYGGGGEFCRIEAETGRGCVAISPVVPPAVVVASVVSVEGWSM